MLGFSIFALVVGCSCHCVINRPSVHALGVPMLLCASCLFAGGFHCPCLSWCRMLSTCDHQAACSPRNFLFPWILVAVGWPLSTFCAFFATEALMGNCVVRPNSNPELSSTTCGNQKRVYMKENMFSLSHATQQAFAPSLDPIQKKSLANHNNLNHQHSDQIFSKGFELKFSEEKNVGKMRLRVAA